MKDEMESLHANHTFELVKLPKGKPALRNKWVYRIKQEDHTSKPLVKMSSIRVVLGLAASLDLEVEQMDVKTAFLHGDLDKEIYMEQPAPRQWYKKFELVMGEQGYRKTTSDHCVFVQKFSDDDFVILLLYVDDILIVGRNVSRIDSLKKQLSKSFAMKDLGPAKKVLGIQIVRDKASKKLYMSQEQYIEKSPSTDKEREDMSKVPYASVVGSLMYAMVCTRLDIAHAVGVLTFGDGKPVLIGYTDSDMAGDIDSRKSTSGYLMTFAGGAVSWQSRLQKCVALSTTEAEYIAAAEACKEMLWMKHFIQELGFKQQRYVIYCDNQSAIHLGKNATFHSRTKHIDVRYHWLRDALNDELFELEKIHTNHNRSDMLTKNLPRVKLEFCCSTVGMTSSSTK
ncbi:retrovirus-related Pol polyprotein from transposon TNT 1-94 [Cucumis melo var. makuwa]|uniref:Retrovirus-related Pol polyprotein from transposon TNT 1-94 n=1 Tax=Cucumis melo var. makuwa TaxID=1194695 RepID=A0A5D3CTW0_CUCMM|nr:retrovirus-related Pol polyprotein from transposon TNT 1-94 [Cucumis melo var. makuwa]